MDVNDQLQIVRVVSLGPPSGVNAETEYSIEQQL